MGRKKSRAAAASAAAPTAWLTTSARTTQQLPAHAPILPPGAEDATSFGAPLEAQVATLADDREGAAVIAARPALTPAEVDAWIAWGERTGFEPQKLARTAWSAHRDNGRLAIESETVAAAIFQRLRPLLPVELDGRRPTGCNPNIRLYKYVADQRFGRHVDQACVLADGSATEYTVLFHLCDVAAAAGGATVFYSTHGDSAPALVSVQPEKGAVLLHAHGRRCLTHEGAAVRSGVKYLLRTDVAYA